LTWKPLTSSQQRAAVPGTETVAVSKQSSTYERAGRS